MTEEQKNGSEEKASANQTRQWDESRVIVLLIGLSLLIEGLLIYYQAGPSQAVVAGVTGLAGVTMLLFAWLVPFEEFEETRSVDEEETDEELRPAALPDQTTQPGQVIEKTAVAAEKLVKAGESAVPGVSVAEKAIEKPVEKPAEKPVEKPVAPVEEEEQLSWFQRLTKGLTKTRTGFVGKLKNSFSAAQKLTTTFSMSSKKPF